MTGIVYFVQEGSDGPIKIGFTRQTVEHRLRSFETGNSSPLRILGWFAAEPFEERRWHKEFAACHKHGEWFYPTAHLLNAINAITATPAQDVLKTPRRALLLSPRQKVQEWMVANGVDYDALAARSRYSAARLKTILRSDYPITANLAQAIEAACDGAVTACDLLADNSRIGRSGMPAESITNRGEPTAA